MNDFEILIASIKAMKEAERIKTERLKREVEAQARQLRDKMAELSRPH